MDTPSVPAPKDDREREILDRLVVIKDELLLLKQDRTQYIRTQDVMALYHRTIEEVRLLNEVRTGGKHTENRCTSFQRSVLPLPLHAPRLITY
jgi:hypothetical protein